MRPLLFTMMVVALVLGVTTTHAAQNVVVVLDDSGSMDGNLGNTTKMEAAKEALYTVLSKLPSDAKVGVILLNNGWSKDKWVVPFGKVDMQSVKSAVSQVDASGGTPLGESMKSGADKLLQARDKEHYGSYRLLIVSDGEANDQALVERYLPDIMARGLTVDVIGVKMDGGHSLATKVNTYRKADDPDSLTKAISDVFAESSGTGDSGQEDFELANAFQDQEVAAAVLKALSATGNHPIGEKPLVKPALDEQGNVQFDENGNIVQEEANIGVFGIIGIIVGLVVVFVIVVSVLMRT